MAVSTIVKRFFLEELVGYRVDLTPFLHDQITMAIFENKAVTPEMIGLLMGSARPVYKPVFCEICKQKIKTGEELGSTGDPMAARHVVHQKCFEGHPEGTEVKPAEPVAPAKPAAVKKEGKK